MPEKVSERHKKLIEDGDRLFAQRLSLDNLWQEMAYQFYPEMAEFRYNRYLGDEFADHLTTSYPLLARRSLGDALSALLRPVSLDTMSPGVWFNMRTENDSREDVQARRWLEFHTGVMRRAMYDRLSGFTRATKEGDHSFVTFGQAPISLELNKTRDRLLYRCHHLKDTVWSENYENQIDFVNYRWFPTARQVADEFGKGRASPELETILRDDPFKKMPCKHFMIETEKYEQRDTGGNKFNTPWVSVWIDVTHDYVMEEVGEMSRRYIIPRWVTIPGSQYASSPAVTAALPDARLIQAMALTLQESGEKYVDPPIVATQEAIRSDIQLFAGGMTYVDAEYDEKLGDALRPLYEPHAGNAMGVAFQMQGDVREQIARAFYLDSLSLPPADVREMTAFEVGQRISEWIRRAMPIFEPMEFEYNGALCDETFNLLLRNGAFGTLDDLPQSLRGADIRFKFESPLHEGADRRKGQKFLEAKTALTQAAELDPKVVPMLNASDTLRDVLKGIGVPAAWTRDEAEMEELMRVQAEADQQRAQLEGGVTGAEVARNLGAAAKDFAVAQAT